MKAPRTPASSGHQITRAGAISAALLLTLISGWLFVSFVAPYGMDAVDLIRLGLVMITSFWLAWGSITGIIGVFSPKPVPPQTLRQVPDGKTVVLVPVYNEDPVATFSRVAAMNSSVVAAGLADRFHFAVLSDTTSLEVAADEALWFERLLREPQAVERIFYRRRTQNIGKKAGNIEDFIRRSGAAYDYAIILDADSLMEAATMAEMARRMDIDPALGLLQTLPRIVNARSFFGRSMQFSAGYLSPIFARGITMLQGREGPFWGHNAIVRIPAFAASCGLPELSGKAPHGGHILSHDYVEAALLARAGWTVRLDTDLGGSFEEGPENLIDYAKRDRRWCQGNLQHRKIVLAPGLPFWNRFTFVQGIMAYLSSPLWLALLATSILAAMLPAGRYIYVSLHEALQARNAALTLFCGVLALLVLPKVLIVIRGIITGDNKKNGGTLRVIGSVLAEIVFSTLLAPIMLLLQSRSVFQVIFGIDGGWPAQQRDAVWLDLRDSWAASWWIVVIGALTLAVTMAFTPQIVLWMLPAIVPMILSPLLISVSSLTGRDGGKPWFFTTQEELAQSPVMVERRRILAAWQHADTGPAAMAAAQDEGSEAHVVP